MRKLELLHLCHRSISLLDSTPDRNSEEKILGHSYHTGKIGSMELVLVKSGIGKVMSAMSVAILADHFQVDAVINTGSAGAVASGIVGDVVIADKLPTTMLDVTAFGYDYGQMAQQPLYFESDKSLISDSGEFV